jgi:hypothetical protein
VGPRAGLDEVERIKIRKPGNIMLLNRQTTNSLLFRQNGSQRSRTARCHGLHFVFHSDMAKDE